MRAKITSTFKLNVLLALAASGSALAQTAVMPVDANNGYSVPAPLLRPPAVSEINGKVDYSGGEMDSYEGHNFSASVTLPVSHQFGFQADALYSTVSSLNFVGGAGHLFWRNPSHGLLGLTGGYLYRDGFDSVDSYQVGAEGQLYWRQFTFGFFGGIGSIDYRYSAPFIDANPTRFVGRVSADYYPLENLRVGGSFTSAYRDYFGKAEAEYQLPINGLALTAEAAWGNYGYDHWLFGVRYYFGGKKSLRDRQRQDDPPSLMPQMIQTLGVYGAEYNRKMNNYIATLKNNVISIGGTPTGGGTGGGYGNTLTIGGILVNGGVSNGGTTYGSGATITINGGTIVNGGTLANNVGGQNFVNDGTGRNGGTILTGGTLNVGNGGVNNLNPIATYVFPGGQ